ncbi:MAG TPA: exopolysaccharide biosynthesis polyprenyl glycosylphosphotransferase [Bdellovibrionota bacterium]|nr:exopolysaccharide biosynthesis polyprenyl glycosylphosphotransferase [Bdellovibrionota bacterium]
MRTTQIRASASSITYSRRRRALTQVLVSDAKWPWVLADLIIGIALFYAFTLFGKYSSDTLIRFHNLIAALAFGFSFALFGLGNGLFDRETRISKLESLRLCIFSWVLAMCAGLALLQFIFFIKVGRISLLYGSLGALIGIYSLHLLLTHLIRKYPSRFIILGEMTAESHELSQQLRARNPHQPYEYVESVGDEVSRRLASDDPEELVHFLDERRISSLVFSQHAKNSAELTKLTIHSMQSGIRVVDERRFYAEIFRRYPTDNFDSHALMAESFNLEKPIINFVKRLLDIILVSLALIPLLPLMIFIALAVRLSSKGPIIYVQERQGRHFTTFKMFKFRTMRLRLENTDDSLVTHKRDPRVTWIGRIIRPLHFDELPQLINILIGDMSLVGPRPAMITFVQKMRDEIPVFEVRQLMRPGLTGLAQISQGYSLDTDDEIKQKLGYDLYYIKKYGVMLDLWIMLRTAFTLAKSAW